MKLYLRWEYNNVRIKEGDEWKVAFTTPKESCFSGLINSPAIFQAIMNELLKRLD